MAEERLEEIREARMNKRDRLLADGQSVYPAEVRRSHSLKEVHDSFEMLSSEGSVITVVGRVMAIRRHGGVVFCDLRDGSGVFQLQLSEQNMPAEIFTRNELMDVGDFVEASGLAVLTKSNKESLALSEIHIIAKSIRPVPSKWYGLKDTETRMRQREVDILLNDKVTRALLVRSRMVSWLRSYFDKHGYQEFELPVLQPIAGGAAARPFVTHHQALNMSLYLRIASELYLKKLLVSGLEKVYEIGPRFRNEGVDREHNPEFTMLESQWAYADYEDLMDFTDNILEELCQAILGKSTVMWQGKELSFAKPMTRINYIETMNKQLGFDILTNKDPQTYRLFFVQKQLELPAIENYYHLVDELYKKLVRPTLIRPTIVYDYPIEMAPLAKAKVSDDRVAEKFQLVAAGMELCNCYTELNDPVKQRQVLEKQLKEKMDDDEETYNMDESYLEAMEYGMPPNAGWSLGIDRMAMLLADVPSIREVILFPLLRPQDKTKL